MDDIFEDKNLKFISEIHELSARSLHTEERIKNYLAAGEVGTHQTLINALIVMGSQRELIKRLMKINLIYSESHERMIKVLKK